MTTAIQEKPQNTVFIDEEDYRESEDEDYKEEENTLNQGMCVYLSFINQ